MEAVKKIADRLLFFTGGELLYGVVFFITGFLVVRMGYLRIYELWGELSPYFPLKLPESPGEWIADSLPYLSKLFISGVSSVSALLIGILWMGSAAFFAVRAGRTPEGYGEQANAALTAESIRRSRSLFWEISALPTRVIARIWPRTRGMSPISYEIVNAVLLSLIKLFLLACLVWAIAHLFGYIPDLIKAFTGRDVTVRIPSASPIVWLLVFVGIANVVIALSMVPLRTRGFERDSFATIVRGRGDPSLFLAIIEECTKLLSAKDFGHRHPIRMKIEGEEETEGTLVETSIGPVRSIGRPGGYLCLPLIVVLPLMGFSRLIYFDRPVAPMIYTEFFSLYFFDYLIEVAFALALILCGLYYAEFCRRLFGIRTFRSILVFCAATRVAIAGRDTRETEGHRTRVHFDSPIKWEEIGGAHGSFATWAKDPRSSSRFLCDLYWAEVLSECDAEDDQRFVMRMQRSQYLSSAIARLIEVPFAVGYERERVLGRAVDDPYQEEPAKENTGHSKTGSPGTEGHGGPR